MELKIDKSKLTDSPYSEERKDSFLFDDDDVLEQIILELRNGTPTSFLISGYRGVGKTSFVNRISEKLSSEFISLNVNLAKYDGYSVLIKKLIRGLYLQYSIFISKEKLSEDQLKLSQDFKLLYDRTFNDIVNSQIVNLKKEKKKSTELELNLKKLIPFILIFIFGTNLKFDWLSSIFVDYLLFITSLIWTLATAFKFTISQSKIHTDTADFSIKSLYDDGIAEYHFLEILKNLQKQGYKMLIAFDEIDKIQEISAVKSVISDLKFLLLSGYANFFVIGGQSLYYEFEKSGYEDDQVINSLFSKNIHIPFLKSASLKKYCFALLSKEEFENTYSEEVNSIINNYFNGLILASSRIPRKLVNKIRSESRWKESYAYLDIDTSEKLKLEKESELADTINIITDNKLPEIARNNVQLDFFIAQVYLWIIKMKEYKDGNFLMSVIINIPSYTDKYPQRYIDQLNQLKDLLIDEMLAQKIIKEYKKEYKIDDINNESSYSWNQEINIESFVESNIELISENYDLENQNTTFNVVENQNPINPSFINDFIEFEIFLREIYIEFIPNDINRKTSLTGIINRLIESGLVTQSWYESNKIKELIDIRNKIVHGIATSPEDVKEIQGAIFTLNRLKSEVLEDLIYYVTLHYLKSFSLVRNKGGYDLTATRDKTIILFEIKHTRVILPLRKILNEIVIKYNNYKLTNSGDIYYALFLFQSNKENLINKIPVKFIDTINKAHPELKNKLYLFYISEYKDKGVKNTIEGYLKELLIQIGSQKNQPITYFDEFELEETEEKIKEKSLIDWPEDYEMQFFKIQNQTKALNNLKLLNSTELGDDIFRGIVSEAKKRWPDDFEMQLSTYQNQRNSLIKLNQVKPDFLSENQFNIILNNAKKSWPDDYEMQLSQFEKQKKAAGILGIKKLDGEAN